MAIKIVNISQELVVFCMTVARDILKQRHAIKKSSSDKIR